MLVYIDDDYKCHTVYEECFRQIETEFFDGKTTYFIESYRYIPYGETWIRKDGVAFPGIMISPWRDHNIATVAQEAYEQAKSEYQPALDALYEGAME